MTWEQIQTTIIGLAVSAIVGLLGKWLGLKKAEETRSAVTWALEQGVALAAHKFQNARATVAGPQKKLEALSVAESLAPKAMSSLPDATKSVLVDAVYARMKTSLPHPSTFTKSGDDIPIDVVVDLAPATGTALSERPTPFPPLRGPVGPGAKGGPT